VPFQVALAAACHTPGLKPVAIADVIIETGKPWRTQPGELTRLREHVVQGREPVSSFWNMRNQRVDAGGATANYRDAP